jgi:CO dehydrogenase/acetyl-CoA synthase beta subunit
MQNHYSWHLLHWQNSLLKDSLVVCIEKDIFDKIDNEIIMKRFQNMKTWREQL